MKRRLNYTGRRSIPRRNISARIREDVRGGLCHLDVRLDLTDMDLPPDAVVFVDAYRRMTESRILELGRVGNGSVSGQVGDFDPLEVRGIKIRIFAVDPGTGRILAAADGIRPESPGGFEGILDAVFDDLDREIWRLSFDGDGGAPVLRWNRSIPGIRDMAEGDPLFTMFVAPAVLRQILIHIVFVDGIESPDDPRVDWHRPWLDFARYVLGQEVPSSALRNGEFDPEAALDWIDRTVSAFCSRNDRLWNAFLARLKENEG